MGQFQTDPLPGVRLFSFVEFQGIIDFRGYVDRQTRKLEADIIYPSALSSSVLLADPTGGRMTLAVMPGRFHAGLLKTHNRTT